MRLFVSLGLLAVTSCAYDPSSARSVSMKPGKGGILTLSPHEDPRARAKADTLMAQTCSGKKAEILEEGDAVVGTSTSSNTEQRSGSASGIKIAGIGFGGSNPNAQTDSVAKNVTEWRITYECK